jgi:hypothetical protein
MSGRKKVAAPSLLKKADCNSEPYLITTNPVELIKQKN